MTTYISLLRGINVSGSNIIKMEALRKLYAELGFEAIQTYVQSGNVVFKAHCYSPAEVAGMIRTHLAERTGLNIPVLVMTVDCLQQIIKNNTFANEGKKDPAHLHVTFLATPPESYDLEALENKKAGSEEITVTEKAIYLYCPQGYGQTKLTNTFFEKRLNVAATTRNWKTTNELLNMATFISDLN